jgi:glycosyltransferase involved in cell wall biosynthesis
VLLYCGTVTNHYDLGLAIQAMANLRGEVPLQLKIMGTGNKLDEVLGLASKLGVRESIELIGSVPIEKVAEVMRQADVGLSCHRAGIFGDLYFSTKLVEYLTQGLCVLSPQTYTVRQYLPEDCLFYFEPGNAVALAETIRYVWRSPGEVVRRKTNARQHLARLSWQTEKDKFLAFYDGLLGVRPAANVASLGPVQTRN